MKLDRFLISYNGNKYLETKKYLKNLDISKYDIIAEPFCGIFGFSRALMELNPDFKGEFYLNDIDKNLIDTFKRIVNDPYEYINDCEKISNTFETDSDMSSYFRKNKDDYRKLIYRHCQQQLFNKIQGGRKIKNYKERIENFNIFFKKCKFSSLENKEFIDSLPKDKKILIFFDPPYFDSNNADYKGYMDYMNEKTETIKDNTYFYIDILENLKNKNNDCLLIINQISILDYLFKDFKKESFLKLYQNSSGSKTNKKRRTNHIIYSNFDL